MVRPRRLRTFNLGIPRFVVVVVGSHLQPAVNSKHGYRGNALQAGPACLPVIVCYKRSSTPRVAHKLTDLNFKLLTDANVDFQANLLRAVNRQPGDRPGTCRAGKLTDLARLGEAWRGLARPGDAWRGLARPGEAWRDLARPGAAWGSLVRPGESWRGLARPGEAWRCLMRLGEAWRGLVKPGEAWRGLAAWRGLVKPDEAWRSLARPGETWRGIARPCKALRGLTRLGEVWRGL